MFGHVLASWNAYSNVHKLTHCMELMLPFVRGYKSLVCFNKLEQEMVTGRF
jgi:hypothetical protein